MPGASLPRAANVLRSIWRRTQPELNADELVANAWVAADTQRFLKGPFWVLALGKVAPTMLAGLWRMCGHDVDKALVVATPSSPAPTLDAPQIEWWVGDHPIPGEGSFRAGERVLAWADEARAAQVPVLVLLSGGSSACCEVPSDGLTVSELRAAHRKLIDSDASIDTINAVRARLSAVKGGGLRRRLGPSLVSEWILCDVPSGNADLVGSGPCASGSTPFATHHIPSLDLSPNVQKHLAHTSVSTCPQGESAEIDRRVLASPETMVDIASKWARELSAVPIITKSPKHYSLSDLTAFLGPQNNQSMGCYMTAGEVGVAVDACQAIAEGGRAQHLLLEVLGQASTAGDWAVMAVASDGLDGSSQAGGVITQDDCMRVNRGELLQAIETFQSAPFLRRLQAEIPGFETTTNLTDLYMTLRLA